MCCNFRARARAVSISLNSRVTNVSDAFIVELSEKRRSKAGVRKKKKEGFQHIKFCPRIKLARIYFTRKLRYFIAGVARIFYDFFDPPKLRFITHRCRASCRKVIQCVEEVKITSLENFFSTPHLEIRFLKKISARVIPFSRLLYVIFTLAHCQCARVQLSCSAQMQRKDLASATIDQLSSRTIARKKFLLGQSIYRRRFIKFCRYNNLIVIFMIISRLLVQANRYD